MQIGSPPAYHTHIDGGIMWQAMALRKCAHLLAVAACDLWMGSIVRIDSIVIPISYT